ncbi:MAG: hypothetical protein J7M26_05410, partial [Armatimonadetes bacterium]|nr:hypothetical protein [Armatimonadota bacterium]
IVAVGDDLAMGTTLDDALAKLYGKQTREPEVQPSAGAPIPSTAAPPAMPTGSAKQLLEKALALDAEAQQLLRSGDLAGYQRKQQEQAEVLRQLDKVLQ